MVSCLFLSFHICSLIKVDWLAACIALRVGSVYRKNLISYLMRKNEEIRGKRLGRLERSLYLLFSPGVGVKFAQSDSQWEERANT
jgi:hypothetical protein